MIHSLVAGRTPASGRTAGARVREVLWILLPAVALVAALVATYRRVEQAAPVERTAPVASLR